MKGERVAMKGKREQGVVTHSQKLLLDSSLVAVLLVCNTI
jgi:hypothetical protein